MAPDKLPFDAVDPKQAPCPICRRKAVPDYEPFCSKRCADVDLHRWLGGVYAVPTDEPGQAAMPDDGES